MAFLGKGKKEDLKILAEELGETVDASHKIIDLRALIENSPNYKEDFVKEMLNTIINTRKEEQAEKERQLEQERAFELAKLRIENKVDSNDSSLNASDEQNLKFELQKLVPKFDPNNDDISIFLTLFERQLKFLKFPESIWVTHLIGSVPNEIANLIAREPEELSQNYAHVKSVLLKRFKLSSEKFRQLFSKHKKSVDSTWKDFYFELKSYFNGWISGLNISTFDQLRDLVIADQIKKRAPPDSKDHFLDQWGNITSPEELVEKLDSYDSIRKDSGKESYSNTPKKKYLVQDKVYEKHEKFKGNTFNTKKENFSDKNRTRSENHRPPLTCYGCGNPGFIRSKCPKCNPSLKAGSTEFNSVVLYTCVSDSAHLAILDLHINGFYGTACTDTGASNSIAGEALFNLLKNQGVDFKSKIITMTLANGSTVNDEVLCTEVTIKVKRKILKLELLVLPKAKGNRTLLGIDFLQKAGIVLDVKNRQWYFHDNPRQIFELFPDNDPMLPQNLPNVFNSCVLREEEGNHLPEDQREELSELIREYEDVFKPGGEPTPFIEHHIPTGDHAPVAGPPYRMSPKKKELLRKELDALLEQGIIEECESPYAAPVVLIPKPNGEVRLCIDYRNLNHITTPDTYPLPRMDDLLQDATPTAYMSTIDLKSGYHQVNVHTADRDKTAFVCPFGTFRFVRMPFGLRNAPGTFQRLMDKFRYGLSSVKMLTYLDDIIVLSSTFEQHLSDLRLVFERLAKFKLHANRDKCHFACKRVKYLGHWITNKGIEVDQEKVASIMNIPSPKTVKQVQSFLQTCSWYRRFISNFSDVSRPLSNLTKKNVQWKWGTEEENAFATLKQCLVTAPILQQADMTKPFIIRTDASAYALGAVLLQGEGSEEHPIEYASRLLTSAECNYSTTEREALAVVWALNKFRGYIEGSEIIISSDHQPLRWLMSLKSPSGRLARWALQIQSYNLKIEYIPGKANVVADMLSRPEYSKDSCEMNAVIVDFPTESSKVIREEQLKDPELKKIIDCFESSPPATDLVNWTERGYLMNQGVLYRYAPDSEVEEAQLVVPTQDRERILKEYHDAPTAGHYGAEGTFRRIIKRYYWTEVAIGCSHTTCGRWRECSENAQGEPICTCHKSCPRRRKPACGTDGRYYPNHCELHRQACVTNTNIAIDHKRLCLRKKAYETTTTTPVTDTPDDISTPMVQTTPSASTNYSPWTHLPQPEPRTVMPSSSSQSITTLPEHGESDIPPQRECSQQEYDFMKENLLLFNNAKLTDSKKPGNEYLVSIMFSHYDQNNNGQLEAEELWQAAEKDHLGQLSGSCILADMLLFDDTDRDGTMTINEFYSAFSKLDSVSVVSLDKSLEVNHVTARVGDNVEIKCDVTGTPAPPIVWRRNDMDLGSLNEDEIKVFVDGSLYLTNVQLIHGGNYTCHAQHNRDVVQTHVLHVHTIPEVHVIPKLQSRAPGELAEMECHVIGVPTPAVSWLKNDEELKLMTDKYTIVGNGTALLVGKITYSDTGAYMCVASNPAGMTRDITSLIVQDQPTPTAPSEERRFFVFHDWGVSVFDPDNCRLYHQIQSTDVIPGTQEYVCGDRGTNCSWGQAINVADRYVYVTQPTKDRVLIISRIQMVVVDVVVTDKVPVDIHYVPHLDQVWILCWRGRVDRGTNTIQIIRDASQKKKHHTVHPEPVDGHFDLVSGLFIPPTQDLGHGWKYGYVVHTNQRGMYKLDLQAMKYIKSVDLTPYNCAPKTADFATLGGFAILECREPITDRPTGQVVLDYLTDTVIAHKTALFGQPHVSPDSRHVVTLERGNNSVVIVAQQITENGLRFLFDVKTTLQIGDITFFPSRTTHNYDLYASSSTKEDILFVNLADGKVEMITGIGRSMDPGTAEWGNTNRPISSAGVFGTYLVTTANEAIFVINGKTRTVNCEIGSTVHPRMVVWAKAP